MKVIIHNIVRELRELITAIILIANILLPDFVTVSPFNELTLLTNLI